jgi:hypothetical protein
LQIEETKPSDFIGKKIGSPKKYEVEENEVVEWALAMREFDIAVLPNDMVAHLMHLHPNTFPLFSRTRDWVYKCVLPNNHLSIRRATHNANVNLTAEQKQRNEDDFVESVKNTAKLHDIKPGFILNMDQTGVHFDMVSTTTVAQKGQKSIAVKATNNPNCCTVFLTVAVNGEKITPLVVFKGQPDKTISKGFTKEGIGYDQRVICEIQENAYCDTRVMLVFIEKCIKPFTANLANDDLALLMMDNFSVHQVAEVRKAVSVAKCVQVQLPPNMTSTLQMLDVGINAPFKYHLKQFYRQYMQESRQADLKPKITRELITFWVAEAWEMITP